MTTGCRLMSMRALVVAAATIVAALAAHAAAPLPARGLIVKLKHATAHEVALAHGAGAHPDGARWQRVLDGAGVAPRRMTPSGSAAQLLEFDRVLSGAEAARLAEALRRRSDVEWVVPNVRERRLQATPNDLLFTSPTDNPEGGQWWLFPYATTPGLRLTGVPDLQSAWAVTPGTPVVVAVLDTGITAHPELAGRVLPGYDFVSEIEFSNDGDGRDPDAADPGDWVSQEDLQDPLYQQSGCIEEPSSWHGTVIAGQLAAITHNAQGVAAVNWNGRVLPVRVAGKCGATVADIVAGMRWAAGIAVPGVPSNPNPARIVNISFGGSAACDQAYQSAVDELFAHGVIVVAAAGNESGAPTRPASCERTVGVAALNRDGFKASYSNFGPAIDIATVGGDAADPNDPLSDSGLLTINNNGTTLPGEPDYAYVTGTSFASPIVAGVAGLMLSLNPALSAQQLVDGLTSQARPHVLASPSLGACSASNPTFCECSTTTCGAGILDARAALSYAQQTPGGSAGGGGDDGGGALGLGWLAGLALAVVLLAGERRKRSG